MNQQTAKVGKLLSKNEKQDQPLLLLAKSYYLNFMGLKTLTVGLAIDKDFEPTIVLSHIRIPSRHVVLTLADWQKFKSHYPIFETLFNENDGSDATMSKFYDFDNFSIVLELMFNQRTVSIIDKVHNVKFSFQKSVFNALCWLDLVIESSIEMALANRQEIISSDINAESSTPLLRLARGEMQTYGCIENDTGKRANFDQSMKDVQMENLAAE